MGSYPDTDIDLKFVSTVASRSWRLKHLEEVTVLLVQTV